MDPYAVLGVKPGTPPEQLAAAYRRAAKRWHPDRADGEAAQARMAEINAAYDLLRDGGWRGETIAAAAEEAKRAKPRARSKGAWLPDHIRQALGGELIGALRDGEEVRLLTPASTWASPSTLLVVTDRRLVWLQDDAIGERVQSAAFGSIVEIGLARRRFRRHVAAIRVRTRQGRRHTFAELRPETAADVVRRVTEGQARAA